MKAKILIITIITVLLTASCVEKWADMNQDPSKITNPPVPEQMFTHSLYRLGDYQYTEWFYDAYHYFYPWSGYTIWSGGNSATVNIMGATGGVYGALYRDVMPMLFEMRKHIDEMENRELADMYRHIYAISYIPQVMQAIKVTDVYGSIVYSEAMMGRYEGVFSAEYNTQEELFDILLGELDEAISTLEDGSTDQVSLGNQDFVYRGDVVKWVKLANTLKLRIANRLMGQDPVTAITVINEVIADVNGPIVDVVDEFLWIPSVDYRGRAHDLYGTPTAPKNACDFMRENHDPRLRFLFEKNAFDQETVDHFNDNALPKPDFIPDVINEPWDRYWGGPSSPDSSNTSLNDYFDNFTDITGSSVRQLSWLNRRLQNPNYQSGTGYWAEAMVPASEACLYFAEYIESGLVSGPVRGKTAQDWYEQGVANSVISLDIIAEISGIWDYEALRLDYPGSSGDEIADLLAMPDYAWGTDNLEKIYIQQFLNFYRIPYEGFTNLRRTGYPMVGSDLLAYEPLMSSGQRLPVPRRFPRMDTDDEWNGDNYRAAVSAQGFTLGANDAATLNSERIWWDITSPSIGAGK